MGTKFLGTIETNEDLSTKKYVDDNNRLFLAQYESTSYADVKAAIDADKNILINFSNNNNLLAATYATYTNGADIHLYAVFVYDGQSMVTDVKLTPQNVWSITQHRLQDLLVSGTNIKTINGTSLLGSGDITIGGGGSETYTMGWDQTNLALTLTDGTTTQTLPLTGLGPAPIDTAMSDVSENAVQNKIIKAYVDAADTNLQSQIDALGEPFRVKQWASNALNVEIPTCTEDISNTSIAKMVFSITGEEGEQFQVVGMIAYEVFDAASGGNRINCWPVCQFTGNGQKELSVRWMCGGTTRKTAKRINAWVLLKHR